MTAADQGEAREALARALWEFDGYDNRPSGTSVGPYLARADWVIAQGWRPPADHAESAAERQGDVCCTNCGADDLGCTACGALGTLAALTDQGAAERGAEVAARALREAADDVRRIREHGLRDDETHGPSERWFEQWLRDRADRLARSADDEGGAS